MSGQDAQWSPLPLPIDRNSQTTQSRIAAVPQFLKICPSITGGRKSFNTSLFLSIIKINGRLGISDRATCRDPEKQSIPGGMVGEIRTGAYLWMRGQKLSTHSSATLVQRFAGLRVYRGGVQNKGLTRDSRLRREPGQESQWPALRGSRHPCAQLGKRGRATAEPFIWGRFPDVRGNSSFIQSVQK